MPNANAMCQPIEVIAVVGPTASGKSAVADELACRLRTEVVSADAMQVYRGMDIGTAKTPAGERRVPLHCIDLVYPDQPYSVALFSKDSHRSIDRLVDQNGAAVVCGGTGLYMRAALEDMDFPAGEQVENPVRAKYEELASSLRPVNFHAMLAERDPHSAALIHPNNVRRVVRAFELLEQGTSYAREHATLHMRTNRRPTLVIGLAWQREELYARINARVDQMLELGLMDEVRTLIDHGFADTLTAKQAIGYKELIDVIAGNRSLDEAIEDIKRATRRYAKRQITWFKADPRVRWLDASQKNPQQLADEALALISFEQDANATS